MRNTSACSSPTREVMMCGTSSADSNTMEYVTIASTGNAVDFGDATEVGHGPTAFSSSTRGICAGRNDNGTLVNILDYITIATTGNSTDFGDLTYVFTWAASVSNGSRGVVVVHKNHLLFDPQQYRLVDDLLLFLLVDLHQLVDLFC